MSTFNEDGINIEAPYPVTLTKEKLWRFLLDSKTIVDVNLDLRQGGQGEQETPDLDLSSAIAIAFFDNHGWDEKAIKIRTPNSDLLLTIENDLVHIGCMCIFDPKNAIGWAGPKEALLPKIKEIADSHECTPWPG